mgnify:CR=1 FL=1
MYVCGNYPVYYGYLGLAGAGLFSRLLMSWHFDILIIAETSSSSVEAVIGNHWSAKTRYKSSGEPSIMRLGAFIWPLSCLMPGFSGGLELLVWNFNAFSYYLTGFGLKKKDWQIIKVDTNSAGSWVIRFWFWTPVVGFRWTVGFIRVLGSQKLWVWVSIGDRCTLLSDLSALFYQCSYSLAGSAWGPMAVSID